MRSIDWAAGLFEGEGTIVTRKSSVGCDISICSTDEDTVDNFLEAVGVGHKYGPYMYGTNRKPFWRWACNNHDAVQDLLRKMLPLFGKRRAMRATDILNMYAARALQPHYTVSRKGMGGRSKKAKETSDAASTE